MAQEVPPEQLALARKYVELTDRAGVYEITLVEIGIGTMRQIVHAEPRNRRADRSAIGKVLETYKSRKGELLDQFARVYAVRFTVEELQEIVAFYESPDRPEAGRGQFRREYRPADGACRSSPTTPAPNSSPRFAPNCAPRASKSELGATCMAAHPAPPCAGPFFVRCATRYSSADADESPPGAFHDR